MTRPTHHQVEALFQSFLTPTNPPASSFLVCQTEQTREIYDQALLLAEKEGHPCHHFNFPNLCRDAYSPILPWIRSQVTGWSSKDLNQLMKKAGVYVYHRPLLKQYILGHKVYRSEELIPKEYEFELVSLHKGLFRMMECLSEGRSQIFVIGNAQNMSASGVSFFLNLWKGVLGSQSSPMRFLFLISLVETPEEQTDFEDWNKFLEWAEEKRSFVNLSMQEPLPTEIPREACPSYNLATALDNYHLLAMEDSRVILEHLNRRFEEGAQDFDPGEQHSLWTCLGAIFYWRKEYDLSMAYFQTALSLAQKTNNEDDMSDLYYRIGLVHFEKRNLDYAKSLSHQSFKLARIHNNERSAFYAIFLQFLIQDKIRMQGLGEFKTFYSDVLHRAKKLRFMNTLAYLSTNPFGLYSDYNEEAREFHRQGLQIAQKAKNIYRLAYAFQTTGLVSAVKGDYSKTLEYYEKSRKLKLKLGDSLEMAYICNGMGFYYYMTGWHQKANKHYLAALNYLRSGKDFDEIGMTLFNMSTNALLGGNPGLALQHINHCLDLLKTMNMRHLAYHSQLGLQVLLGVVLIKKGDLSQAWQVNLRIQMSQLKPFPKKNEEFFLLHLFRGLLTQDENELEQAEFYLFEKNDNIEYFAPFYYLERGDYALNQRRKEEAERLWQKGLVLATSKRNTHYTKMLEQRLYGGSTEFEDLGLKGLQDGWGWILTSARMQKHLVTLHQRIEDIQFLNTFQTVISEALDHEDLIKKSLELLYNGLMVAGLYFIRWTRRSYHIEFSKGLFSPAELSTLEPLLIALLEDPSRKFYKELPLERLPGPLRDKSVYSLFLGDQEPHEFQLVGLFETRYEPVKADKLQILSIVGRQLALSWSRLEQQQIIKRQNEEMGRKNLLLEKTSTTDHLTGLGNRQALYSALKLEMARINRSSRSQDLHLSVLFIDLDNFKFFNDNFGHAVGDLLLVETAKLLEQMTRDTDLVFRYGGDEFVILLPETSLDGAMELSERLVERLVRAGSFQQALEDAVGAPLEVPEEKNLSCSVGVSGYDGTPDKHNDFQKLLSASDKALYSAKAQGKSRAVKIS